MLVTFHDASWASRKGMSSQRGLLTVLTDESVMTGQVKSFSPIAWQPRRLLRVCRSSTAAEVQMASSAIDSHEFVKQTLLEWFNFNVIESLMFKTWIPVCRRFDLSLSRILRTSMIVLPELPVPGCSLKKRDCQLKSCRFVREMMPLERHVNGLILTNR